MLAPAALAAMSTEAGVKVFCRFRPFNKREIALGADKGLELEFTPNGVKFANAGRQYQVGPRTPPRWAGAERSPVSRGCACARRAILDMHIARGA